MTEKTMERRRRYRQRRRRNTVAVWIMGAACAALLALFAAMEYADHISKLPHPESSGLPGLALGGSNQGTPAPAGGDSRPQDPEVYVDSTDWNLRLVNRWNPIPEGYALDLRELPGGEKVDGRIYELLMEMFEAAKEGNQGELPRVISGYRTQEAQQELYDAEVNKYKSQGYSEEDARTEAGKWVAVPGTSEHQLGLAVDVEGVTYDVFFWLQENSWKYGFIFRYPGDKTDVTGTVEEVWHYRYVGKEAATEMYEQGLCLEEYLEMKDGEET